VSALGKQDLAKLTQKTSSDGSSGGASPPVSQPKLAPQGSVGGGSIGGGSSQNSDHSDHSEVHGTGGVNAFPGAASVTSEHLLDYSRIKYNKENVVGRGGMGVVYKGTLFGEDIAVKAIQAAVTNETAEVRFLEEIRIHWQVFFFFFFFPSGSISGK